jgi:hypothetical protein
MPGAVRVFGVLVWFSRGRDEQASAAGSRFFSQDSARTPNSVARGFLLGVFSVLFVACSAGAAAVSQAGAGALGPVSAGSPGTGASGAGAAGRRSNGPAAGSGGVIVAAGSGGVNLAAGSGGVGLAAGSGGLGAAAAGRMAGAGSAGVGGAAGSGAMTSDKLVPAHGALLGHYYGDGTVAATDARIGRKPAIHLVYYAWEDDWPRQAAGDFSDGTIPLVNWEPNGIDFKNIVSGSLDATIKARASGSKDLGKPFFLDFAAEMNGDEAWSGNDAALYISAYRHIHDLFVAAGASNVVWAWCPNVTDVDGSNKHTLDYYPGDDYVDWTGVDGYNWGAGSGFSWQSFHDVFARIYPILATKAKPILIGEMACDENGGDKAAWIDAMVPTLRSDFPLIKGVVWFDVHKERSWQVNSSAATLAAYTHFAADPYMNP